MKSRILVVSILAFVFVFAVSVYAAGQNDNGNNGNQVQQQTQTVNQGEIPQIQAQTQNMEQVESGNATDTNKAENSLNAQSQVRDQKQERAQIDIEEHRNVVSEFVQSLLLVADREGGIGQQVRVIAQQQNQSASTTVQAMEKVQTRSKVKTFFFGSDYKNLGALRSEMVQTENRLEQLNKLMENIQNEGDKTELQSQIQTLEQEQEKIETFLNVNENKFSLFGWFTRLFNK